MSSIDSDPLIGKFVRDFDRLFMLSVLYEGPIHGYGLMDRYRVVYNREIVEGTVYPFLAVLRKKGLVSLSLAHDGVRERKVYELTVLGRVFCEALFLRFQNVYAVALENSVSGVGVLSVDDGLLVGEFDV